MPNDWMFADQISRGGQVDLRIQRLGALVRRQFRIAGGVPDVGFNAVFGRATADQCCCVYTARSRLSRQQLSRRSEGSSAQPPGRATAFARQTDCRQTPPQLQSSCSSRRELQSSTAVRFRIFRASALNSLPMTSAANLERKRDFSSARARSTPISS